MKINVICTVHTYIHTYTCPPQHIPEIGLLSVHISCMQSTCHAITKSYLGLNRILIMLIRYQYGIYRDPLLWRSGRQGRVSCIQVDGTLISLLLLPMKKNFWSPGLRTSSLSASRSKTPALTVTTVWGGGGTHIYGQYRYVPQ